MADSFPIVFAQRARREQGVMGREKRGRLSRAFLLPIIPCAPLGRLWETIGDESG